MTDPDRDLPVNMEGVGKRFAWVPGAFLMIFMFFVGFSYLWMLP